MALSGSLSQSNSDEKKSIVAKKQPLSSDLIRLLLNFLGLNEVIVFMLVCKEFSDVTQKAMYENGQRNYEPFIIRSQIQELLFERKKNSIRMVLKPEYGPRLLQLVNSYIVSTSHFPSDTLIKTRNDLKAVRAPEDIPKPKLATGESNPQYSQELKTWSQTVSDNLQIMPMITRKSYILKKWGSQAPENQKTVEYAQWVKKIETLLPRLPGKSNKNFGIPTIDQRKKEVNKAKKALTQAKKALADFQKALTDNQPIKFDTEVSPPPAKKRKGEKGAIARQKKKEAQKLLELQQDLAFAEKNMQKADAALKKEYQQHGPYLFFNYQILTSRLYGLVHVLPFHLQHLKEFKEFAPKWNYYSKNVKEFLQEIQSDLDNLDSLDDDEREAEFTKIEEKISQQKFICSDSKCDNHVAILAPTLAEFIGYNKHPISTWQSNIEKLKELLRKYRHTPFLLCRNLKHKKEYFNKKEIESLWHLTSLRNLSYGRTQAGSNVYRTKDLMELFVKMPWNFKFKAEKSADEKQEYKKEISEVLAARMDDLPEIFRWIFKRNVTKDQAKTQYWLSYAPESILKELQQVIRKNPETDEYYFYSLAYEDNTGEDLPDPYEWDSVKKSQPKSSLAFGLQPLQDLTHEVGDQKDKKESSHENSDDEMNQANDQASDQASDQEDFDEKETALQNDSDVEMAEERQAERSDEEEDYSHGSKFRNRRSVVGSLSLKSKLKPNVNQSSLSSSSSSKVNDSQDILEENRKIMSGSKSRHFGSLTSRFASGSGGKVKMSELGSHVHSSSSQPLLTASSVFPATTPLSETTTQLSFSSNNHTFLAISMPSNHSLSMHQDSSGNFALNIQPASHNSSNSHSSSSSHNTADGLAPMSLSRSDSGSFQLLPQNEMLTAPSLEMTVSEKQLLQKLQEERMENNYEGLNEEDTLMSEVTDDDIMNLTQSSSNSSSSSDTDTLPSPSLIRVSSGQGRSAARFFQESKDQPNSSLGNSNLTPVSLTRT